MTGQQPKEVTIKLKRAHVNQKQIIEATRARRFVVAACGRRFGKTEAAKQIVVQRALAGQRVWWLMPTFSMSSHVWRDVKSIFKNFPGMSAWENERLITLPTGGMIEVRSTHNPDSLRGAGLDYVVLDEAAFMEPEVWPAIVRPMLMDGGGGALFLSTPYGLNWFHSLYQLGIAGADPEWKTLHFTSFDNPRIPPEEIESARETTPERIFREEYLAEFLSDGGSVFRGIDDVCVGKPTEPIPGHRYVFGVDWGRDNDYTVISVFDAAEKRMVAMDRFNKIGWNHQRGRLMVLAEKWQPAIILAEVNSIGSVNIEELQREGLPVRSFVTSGASKPALIESLSLAIEKQAITLLDDPVLKGELRAYQLERLPSGNYRYTAPSGMHDDTVMSTALAWRAIDRKKPGRITFA